MKILLLAAVLASATAVPFQAQVTRTGDWTARLSALEDLVRMRIHGITPQFIRDARAAGFKDLDEEDLVDLSIHGRRWLKKRG